MTKVLFLDMDGTLLTDNKELSDVNKEAIKKALAAEHKVIISTGRPLVSGKALAAQLGLTGEGCFAITFNGGEIYDLYNKKTIYKKTIPLAYVRHIFKLADEHGLHCQTYDEHHVLAKQDTRELKNYVERTNISPRIVPDMMTSLTKEPVKLIVIDLDDHEKLVRFREDTAAWAEGKVDQMFSSIDYLEHIAPGVSKGNAVRFLCEYLSIPLEHTIAAGDAENDISMLRAAAVGVAMANAEPNVKVIADVISTRDNNHDGVAEIIENYLL